MRNRVLTRIVKKTTILAALIGCITCAPDEICFTENDTRVKIDFINSVADGVSLLRELDISNLKLMPDTFHMNIEDPSIADTLSNNIADIAYIHFADSNRLAPGQGHIDFDSIFQRLQSVNYQGWVSLEILPKPSPDIAAKQAVDFLMPRIVNYNQN